MTQEELNKQQVKAYEDDIKDYLKKAKICFNVTVSLVLFSVLATIILLSTGLVQDGYSIGAYIGFGLLYIAVPICSMLCVREFNEVVQFPHKDSKKKNIYIFYFVLFCPPIRWIAGSVIGGMFTCAYMTGWYFGLACIPNIVGYIFMAKAYRAARDKWEIQYANEIQASKEYKEKQRQLAAQQAVQKEHDKEVATALNLLSKVGNKFFVKYYFQLKDWSEPDIIDIIQEDYAEETKIQRIRKAKEIFDKNLSKVALQMIADISNNTVDEEIRQKANELLEQSK